MYPDARLHRRRDAPVRNQPPPHSDSRLLRIVTEPFPDWLQSLGSACLPPRSCPEFMHRRRVCPRRQQPPPHSGSRSPSIVTEPLPDWLQSMRLKRRFYQLKKAREAKQDKAAQRTAELARSIMPSPRRKRAARTEPQMGSPHLPRSQRPALRCDSARAMAPGLLSADSGESPGPGCAQGGPHTRPPRPPKPARPPGVMLGPARALPRRTRARGTL